MTKHVDKSSKNESTSPVSHCSHSQASLWSLKAGVRLSISQCQQRATEKPMASAPQLYSCTAPLPINPVSLTYHSSWQISPQLVIYPCMETKRGLRKGPCKHSQQWQRPELDNYEWDWSRETRPGCLDTSVYLFMRIFKIVCILSCVLWDSWQIFLLILWHLTLTHSW